MAQVTPAAQLTITRATTATYVGANGNIVTAVSNEPRYEFDPVTLAPKGLLVEQASTNLLLFSEQFDNAAWLKSNSTVTSNVAISPDNTTNADKLIEDLTNNAHGLVYPAFGVIDRSVFRTLSLYVKAAERTQIQLQDNAFSNNFYNAVFDLTTRTVVTTVSGAAILKEAKIKPLANGWFRLELSGTPNPTSGGNSDFTIRLVNEGLQSYLGDGVSGMLIWGAQAELSSLTSYISTTTAAVTRTADVVNVDGVRYSNNTVAGQGTMYVSFEPNTVGKDSTIALSLNDGTLNNSFRVSARNSGTRMNLRGVLFTPTMDYFFGNNLGASGANINLLRNNGITTTESSIAGTVIYNFNGGAYDGVSTVLAAGSGDRIHSSTDNGVTWVDRSITDATVGGTFAQGKYVVTGNTGFRISTNEGVSWRRVNVTGQTQQQNDIAYNGTNLFVSVGNAGTAYTSPTGEVWTAQNTGRTGAINGIVFGVGLFVASLQGTATQSIITSPDGITWTSRTTPSITANDVGYNGTNLFVLVGNGGLIQTSPDAITWTSRTSGTTNTFRGVHFAAGQWVAVADGGVIRTSPDGITWTGRTSGVTLNYQDVTYAAFAVNPLWVAVGQSGLISTSSDAITWTTRATSPLGTTTQTLNGIVTSGSSVVLCGASSNLFSSTDGINYFSRSNFANTCNRLFFGNNLYLAACAGSVNYINVGYYDSNFVFTKVQLPSLPNNTCNFFVYLNGKYYIGLVGRLLSSTDLINFTIVSAVNSSFSYAHIVSNGDTVVVGGTGGDVLISTDNGATFSTTPIDAALGDSFCNGLFYREGLYIAVGLSGVISSSPDGVNWTQRYSSPATTTLRLPDYSTKENMYYVVGEMGLMLTSVDGLSWSPISNRASVNMVTAGTPTFGNNLPNLNTGTNKIAVSFKTGSMSVAMNGSNVTTKAVGTVPVTNRLSYGMNGVSGMQLNGYIKDVQFFKQPLSEAELAAITL